MNEQTIPPAWVAFLSPFMSGITFTILAIALVLFLRSTAVGHRILIRMALAWFSMRALASFDQALWNPNVAQWLYFISSIVGIVAALYLVWQWGNVYRTLRESEFLDRIRADDHTDHEQRRYLMVHASRQTRIQAEALVDRSRNALSHHPIV